MNYVKLLSVAIIILIVLNLFLFSLGRLGSLMFWGVIIFCALMAFYGIPYLKKRNSEELKK